VSQAPGRPRRRVHQARAFGVDGGSAINRSALNHRDLAEISLANLREHRADAARWLAVGVLLSDEAALEDDDLVIRLHTLQDRLEAMTRVRYAWHESSTASATLLPLP
jgi:hypothetical protein